MIKSLPNQRRPWFSPMEVLIEAWWQPGEFGLVCLVNAPGEFVIKAGQPLAQMALFRAEGGFASLEVDEDLPVGTLQWRARRYRPDYRRDLDYQRGRYPDGSFEPTHILTWRTYERNVGLSSRDGAAEGGGVRRAFAGEVAREQKHAASDGPAPDSSPSHQDPATGQGAEASRTDPFRR